MRLKTPVIFPLILMLLSLSPLLHAQSWSGTLDDSRAVDWSKAGIAGGVPNRSTICATLSAGASSSQINSAIAACPSGQVVFLNAGTYNLSSGISFNGHSNVTLRGAGPTQTLLKFTGGDNCGGQSGDLCLISSPVNYSGSASTQAGGSNACSWTGGYSKGTTSITLNTCGSTPPTNQLLILDQLNDTSDTGGVFICDVANTCRENGGGNEDGRTSGGTTRSYQQVVKITAVSGSGKGPFTVTISPGIYANHIRTSQSPGAWWPGQVTMDGVENLSMDHSSSNVKSGSSFYNCYQCWLKNIRSINANRNHVWLTQSARVVIRDSYFFGTHNGAEESYGIEPNETSDDLIENNIFQQVTSPVLFGQGTGVVTGYNFTVGNVWNNPVTFMQVSYTSHNAGSMMNLWEGNNVNGITCDDTWGSSDLATYFRNEIIGWQPGKNNQTYPIELDKGCRGYNIVGNVLGESGYHKQYEVSPGVGSTSQGNSSIYEMGWSGQFSGSTDSLVRSTLLRWGNYDVVNGSVQWNTSEIPTTSVPYIDGNPVPADRNLPDSYYYTSKPSWWGTMPWPPIGPDVTGGTGPAGLTYALPAELCYVSAGGVAAGTGSVLNIDASKCYGEGATGSNNPPPAPPTNLSITVQ